MARFSTFIHEMAMCRSFIYKMASAQVFMAFWPRPLFSSSKWPMPQVSSMVSQSIYKCKLFLACRLRHIFLFSLTLFTRSIFGYVPDIKVQIFSGYSSPWTNSEVFKNTQPINSKTHSEAKAFIRLPPRTILSTRERRKTTTTNSITA